MSPHAEHPLIRATTWVGVICILALTLLAASPTLHAGLHAADGRAPASGHAQPDLPVGDADHTCVVTLFAHGVTGLLLFCWLILVRPLARGIQIRAVDQIAALRPHYWLVPSHAPPTA